MKESDSLNILSDKIRSLYYKNNYAEVVKTFEYFNDYQNILELSDDIYILVVTSYFRIKDFKKAVYVSKKISEQAIDNSHLINEVLGESTYQLNELECSLEFYNKALDIIPALKSATVKSLVLKHRLGYMLSNKDIEHALNISEKSKRIEWVRDIAYIYYSIGNYVRANYCLETIVRLNGKLDFIDQLTYSLRGIANQKNYVEFLLPNREDNKLYRYKHINNSSKKLIVIISPHFKYLLQSYKFDGSQDLLFIGDATSSYYTFTYKEVARLIENIVGEFKYEQLTLVGASKGGTGCLLMYPYLSDNLITPIKCIAFSPQIKLYPFNNNLIIPSYRDFIKNCEINPIVRSFAVEAPNIEDIQKRDSDEIIVVYGKGYEMDVIETAPLLNNLSIKLVALNYSAHATIIPYTIPSGKTYEELTSTYSNLRNSKDKDFMALGGDKTANIIDEIWELYQNPDIELNKII
tara:strand:+ start:6782 stop:8173 length:1392 start_codon:yes stop_codon:yes gene_type:complete